MRLVKPQGVSPLNVRALHCRSLEENEFPHVLSGGMMSSTSVETAGRSSGRFLNLPVHMLLGYLCACTLQGRSCLPWLLNAPTPAQAVQKNSCLPCMPLTDTG